MTTLQSLYAYSDYANYIDVIKQMDIINHYLLKNRIQKSINTAKDYKMHN